MIITSYSRQAPSAASSHSLSLSSPIGPVASTFPLPLHSPPPSLAHTQPSLSSPSHREEAEDDGDLIEECSPALHYAWEAEENPFRSMRRWGGGNCFNRQEPVENAEDLAENHWWACLRPAAPMDGGEEEEEEELEGGHSGEDAAAEMDVT